MRAFLLALAATTALHAGDAPAPHALIEDPAGLLEGLADGPWGRLWDAAGEQMQTRALAALPPAWQVAGWDGLQRALRSVRWAGIHGGTEGDLATIATSDGGAAGWPLLGGAGDAPFSLGAWSLSRLPDRIVLRRGTDPGPGPLVADDASAARLRLSLPLGRSSSARSWLPGSATLDLEAAPGPEGLHETWRVSAGELPVRPIDPLALDWVPAAAASWGAVGIDGVALRAMLRTEGAPLPCRQLLALGDELVGGPAGWSELGGTWSWAFAPGTPLPSVTVRLPTAAGPLLERLLRRAELDPAAADDAPLLLPLRLGPLPFLARRMHGRWLLGTDLASMAAPGLPSALAPTRQPKDPQAWLIAGTDGAELARILAGLLPAAALNQDRATGDILRLASLALARTAPQVPPARLELLRLDALRHHGQGINSLLALLPPLAMVRALGDHLPGQAQAARQRRLQSLTDRRGPDGLPTDCLCGAGGAGHWQLLAAPTPSLPERPRLLLDAACGGPDETICIDVGGSLRRFAPSPLLDAVLAELRRNPTRNDQTTWSVLGGSSLISADGRVHNLGVYHAGLNCRLLHPGPGWESVDRSRLTPGTLVMYTDPAQDAIITLIAEPHAQVFSEPAQVLAAMSGNLLRQMPGAERIGEGAFAIGGLPVASQRWRLPATAGAPRYIRDDLAFVSKSGIYQLIAVSRESASQADALRDRMLAGFAFIEPGSVEPPLSTGAIGELADTQGGWRLKLPGSGWAAAPDVAEQSGWATHGARWGGMHVLAATWRLPHATSADALASALFALLDGSWPGRPYADSRPHAVGTASGLRCSMSRTIEGTPLRYRLLAMRDGDRATLVVAWAAAGSEDRLDGIIDGWTPAAAADSGPAAGDSEVRAGIFLRLARYAGARKRFAEALPWQEAAHAADQNDPTPLLELVGNLHQLGRGAEALERIRAAPAGVGDHLDVASWRAFLLSQVGRDAEAAEAWQGVFAAGSVSPGDFRLYLELLWRIGRSAEALASFDRFPGIAGLRDARLLQAELLRRAGRASEAAERLLAWTSGASDPGVQLAIAAAWRDAGDTLQALAACERARGLAGVDNAALQSELGECHWLSGELRKARDAFGQATELDPGNSHARAMASRIDAILGRDARAALRWGDSIPAVAPLDTTRPEPAAGTLTGQDAVWLSRDWSASVGPGQDTRWTRRDRILVLTSAGASNAASWSLPFDSGWQELCINRLCVLGADGTVLSEADPKDAWVEDGTADGQGGTQRIARIPLQGVRPGSEVLLEATWRVPGGAGDLPFQRIDLSPRLPAVRQRVTIDDPAQRVRLVASACPLSGQDGTRRWVGCDGWPGWRFEPYATEDARWSPTVDLSTPAGSWKEAGDYYLDRIRDILAAPLDEAAPAIAPDSARITAIAEAVQRDISYVAIEFGRRGRIPETPKRVGERRIGDCKDHAVLLRARLRAAGIAAHLVLCGAHPLREEFPDLDQFNHMVVAVPDGDGWRIIDPTQKHLDMALPVPAGMAGGTVLLLDPEAPRLITCPAYPMSTLAVRRTIRPADDGSCQIAELVEIDGYFADPLRAHLQGNPPAEHARIIQGWLGSHCAGMDAATVRGLDDKRQPLRLELSYRHATRLSGDEHQRVGRLEDAWATDYLGANASPGRRAPFEVRYPFTYRLEQTVVAPAGWKAAVRPASPHADDQVAGIGWRTGGGADGRAATVTMSPLRGPADDYAAFVERMAAIRARLGADFSMTRP